MPVVCKVFQKKREGNMLIIFYVLLYANTKRNTKLLIITSYKYRFKNSLKYINKLNPTIYKNNI